MTPLVVGVVLGAALSRERFGGPRIAAALLAAGIALMLTGG
jgi:hypothetical protein